MLARLAVLLLFALPTFAADHWHAIDGDSVRSPTGESIRVMGVDTPELGGARCESEYRAAVAARAFTQAALDRGPVRLEGNRLDKYRRRLAVVWVGERDLAALLIAAGHGRPYAGGRREPWC